MDKKRLKEILATHADRLIQGQAGSEDYLEDLPDQDEELARLLAVAERVQSTLKPLSPPDKFEQDLKKELLSIAQRRQAEGYTPPNPAQDLLVLVATFIFVLSLTVVLLALRHRQQQP